MKETLKSPEPVIVTNLFPEILDRLIRLLRGFHVVEWQKPTVCPGWTVKDVALHLLGVEVGNLSTRRDGHVSSSSIKDWEGLVTFINEWNQEWVRVSKRISPQLLIDLLEFTGGQVCEYFQSLDPYALGGSISWVGNDRAPVWLDISREYTERWHHQQHIRDAVDKPGLKEPRYFAPVLSTFVRALPRALRTADAAEGTIVTITISGQSGGQWSARQERGSWQFYEGAVEQPEAEVIFEEDDAWRLFTRGLSSKEALERSSLVGDKRLGMKVLDMVSIIA